MSPFFDNRSDSTNSLTIADLDMPIFCSCVLPSIENYVSFERYEQERRTHKSEIYQIEFDLLSKALAKVGIIITQPVSEEQ